MKFNKDTSEVFVPDKLPETQALARTTHMAVGAHQDDLEIMAVDGILKSFQKDDKWFCGIVMTDGSGSPRDDLYKNYSDEMMREIRRKEQKKAAVVGEYGALIFLDYSSGEIKDGSNQSPLEDLRSILKDMHPEVIYTHNLADKHDTHVASSLRLIEAIRSLPASLRPRKVYGCEVWRDLDWMTDEDKIAFDLSVHPNLQASLVGVFDSQICGGKRYDLATMGRRRANATYYSSHSTDIASAMIFAMDLSPLILQTEIDINSFIQKYLDRFKQDVANRIKRLRSTKK
jgi:LmbE family N-acetylglucosaminyl deacetylase